MCLRAVRIDRRLVAFVLLGSDVVAAVVAVGSDAAKGERFAEESSCCGCNKPTQTTIGVSREV
jgi:hypothetical protein